VRTLLELSAVEFTATGVNTNKLFLSKATIFDMRDDGNYSGTNSKYSPNGALFSHCGLVTNDFKPKRSWYHVQTLKNVLGDYRFNKEVIDQLNPIVFEGSLATDPKPRVYDYVNTLGDHVLAIWSPTSSATLVSNQKTLKLKKSTLSSNLGITINDPYPFYNCTSKRFFRKRVL
jgi:hypothetical protein